MDKVEFIFSEFFSPFKPNRENVLKYFPEAGIKEYNESNTPVLFPMMDARRLYHMGDYQDWMGLVMSQADIAIAFDADLHIVSDRVRAIIPLVKKFGFCVAGSGRYLVSTDARIGADSDKMLDETFGTGYAMCNALVAVSPQHEGIKKVLMAAARMMRESPTRGPLILWRAIWETGIHPYILPQQWCVCQDKIGIGDEIILHCGDRSVREHYGISAN